MTDVFRKGSAILTDEKREAIYTVKSKAEELYALLTHQDRETSLAKTKLEEAIMWAVKSLSS